MKLTDIDGRWVFDVRPDGMSMRFDGSIEGAQGVEFQCPLCGAEAEPGRRQGRNFLFGVHYIQILFSNPRGVEPAAADCGVTDGKGGHPRWTVESGTSLADLTLSPSINCDIPWKHPETGVEYPSACKFHGYIKNGDAQ